MGKHERDRGVTRYPLPTTPPITRNVVPWG